MGVWTIAEPLKGAGMLTGLFWLTLALAALDWAATEKNWRNVRWISKPGTLIALIAWFTQVSGWQGPTLWFGLALVFSLLGDILLHLPERFFIPGIGAFFAAQCCYISGFSLLPLAWEWQVMLPLLLVAGLFAFLIRRIYMGMQNRQLMALFVPVMAYAIVISLMWLSGISTLFRPAWGAAPAVLVAIGTGLFYLSDLHIAVNRFVKESRHADLLVMVTYHAGQVLITSGVLAQFAQ